MDISMQTISLHDVYHEPINVVKSSTVFLHGIAHGDIHVSGNSQIIIHGIVHGNIYVESGSSVEIPGIVYAATINPGGLVTISGIVQCQNLDLNSVRIMPKAIINGTTY